MKQLKDSEAATAAVNAQLAGSEQKCKGLEIEINKLQA